MDFFPGARRRAAAALPPPAVLPASVLRQTVPPDPIEAPATRAAHERSAHGDVSRTWELEMLVSGAVFFALLQLPSVMDGVYRRLDPRFSGGLATLLDIGYVYGKAALYAVIACLLVHLVGRAYWVGLIGLDSVFPWGVRWEEVRQGRLVKEEYRKLLPSLPTLIARTDNFCSVLFSFGFLLVLMFGLSIVALGLLTAVEYALARVFFGGVVPPWVSITAPLVITLPLVLPSMLDRAFGERLDPDGWVARALRASLRGGYRLGLMGVYGPIMMILFSNIRRKVIVPVFFLAFGGLMMFVVAARMAQGGKLSVDGFEYLPADPDARTVDYRYYESQRPADELFDRAPSIQSDVISDPYVKLFIPYVPIRHNAAVAARCPGVRPLNTAGLSVHLDARPPSDKASEAVLRCLAGIHQVTLNGAPLRDPGFQFYSQPRTGLRGIVAYIPTAGLPRGRNVLTVQPVQRQARQAVRRSPEPPYVIPFWL